MSFTSAPVLRHFDPDKPSTIECDSSDYVNAGCLSHLNRSVCAFQLGSPFFKRLHNGHEFFVVDIIVAFAFFSRKLSPAECNYDIYDKELMAVVQSFEEWRAKQPALT
jgi:hypothetical protein